jgi:hypothetical protein
LPKRRIIAEKLSRLDGFVGREVQFEATSPAGKPIHGTVRIFGFANPPSVCMVMAMRFSDELDPAQRTFLDSLHLGKKIERQP